MVLLGSCMQTISARVTAGSVIHYLACIPWTDEEIFGETVSLLYNEYVRFSKGRICELSDLVDFLRRSVDYVFSVDKFSWRYSVAVKDSQGNASHIIHRILVRSPPFSGSDNFAVLTFPLIDDLRKALESQIPNKIFNEATVQKSKLYTELIEQVGCCSRPGAAYAICVDRLGEMCPEPCTVLVGKLLAALQMKCQIKRYVNVTFHPYSSGHNPVGQETLNTFSGFAISRYIPRRVVDVKTTLIWEYFRDVFGHGSDLHAQVKHILNLIAFMVQFPQLRTERIICIKSKEEGSGKSFLFQILNMIFSGYTSFHDNLETYLQRFNFSDNSKKIIWLDDIYGSTLRDTRKIFPKVTCRTQQYEKKGETLFSMDEFSEVFVTSNQNCPLHIKPTDRRQLIFQVSLLKLRNRDFFKRTALECMELDVAHAWFTFFMDRDLTDFSPAQDPETGVKGATIAACMVKSHIFVRRFFRDEWYGTYKDQFTNRDNWVKDYEIARNTSKPHKDEIRLRITQKRIYGLYTKFRKEFYPSSKTRDSDTFWEELADLGIERHMKRRRINNMKRLVVDIYYSTFKKSMQKLYDGIDIACWCHQENFVEFTEEMKTWCDNRFE